MITVLVPTRGRAVKSAELQQSFAATTTLEETTLLFIVDRDDPHRGVYDHLDLPILYVEGGCMADALNQGAAVIHEQDPEAVLGFLGDDHRFRSIGWDKILDDHLAANPGMAFCNDLLMGGELPTEIFMSASVYRALGWMAMPGARHLYLDNAWKDLGNAADCLTYFPEIVIEHMHPSVGKAQWDAGYLRNNSETRYSEDRAAFDTWRQSDQFQRDVDATRRAIARSPLVGDPGPLAQPDSV